MIPLFDLSLQLNGFPIKKAKAQMRVLEAEAKKKGEM